MEQEEKHVWAQGDFNHFLHSFGWSQSRWSHQWESSSVWSLHLYAYSLIGSSRRLFLCRSWSSVQKFGLQSECCLAASTHGLSLLCREGFINRGDTRQKSIISEWPFSSPTLVCMLWFIYKPRHDVFIHCVIRQRQYSWVFYTWWGQSEKHKEEMLSERMVGQM